VFVFLLDRVYNLIIMIVLTMSQYSVFISLLLAVVFGAILGIERNLAGKGAGTRTYALVSLGSALFVNISRLVIAQSVDSLNFDPLRMASQIIVGIGFIGAGLVVLRGGHLTGVTTAAGLWVSAGVGTACGFELYSLALFTTGLALFIFTVLWLFERYYVRYKLAKMLGRKTITPTEAHEMPTK